MEQDYHSSPALPPEVLRALCTDRRDGPGILRIAVQLGGMAVAAPLAFTPGAGTAGLLAFCVYSALLGTLFGPFHETLHRTAFRTRWLGEAVCWLTCTLLITTPTVYRAFHGEHHRHTHQLGHDPELFVPALARWAPNATVMLAGMSGLPMTLIKVGWLLAGLRLMPSHITRQILRFVPPVRLTRVCAESWLVFAVHALVMAGLSYAGLAWWRWLLSWWLSHAVLSTYVSVEHAGLTTSGSVLERTRSMRTNGIVRFLFWNMPYHAEHHGWPAVPFYNLPALSARVEPELPNVSHGYARLLSRVLWAQLRGVEPPRV